MIAWCHSKFYLLSTDGSVRRRQVMDSVFVIVRPLSISIFCEISSIVLKAVIFDLFVYFCDCFVVREIL